MPAAPGPAVATARARLAAIRRHHPNDIDSIAAARERLREANVEDYVRGLAASAPPLSIETRARLAAILLQPAEDGAA